MPKKEIEKGSTEVEVEPTPSTEAVVVEPTPEEQVVTLSAQITELTKQVGEKDESYKGLQRTLNQKDAKLREQAEIGVWQKGMEDRFEIMATLLDKRLASGEMDEGEKANLKQEFTELGKRQTREMADARERAEAEAYGEKARAVYARAQKAFGDDIDSLDKVLYNLDKGRLGEAETRVSKAEKEAKVPNEPKGSTETEDELVERIARKRGLLKGESLIPAGKTRTPEQVAKDFIEGKATHEEYEAIRDKLTYKEE